MTGLHKNLVLAATIFILCSHAVAQVPPGVYVAIDRENCVLHYDSTGKLLRTVDDLSNVGHNGAIGLATDPGGGLYLSRGYSNQVHKYNTSTQKFVQFTSGGKMNGPHQFAFGGPSNDMYVASYYSADIECFDGITGQYKSTVVSGLSGCVSVDVAPDGTLYFAQRAVGIWRHNKNGKSKIIPGINPEKVVLGQDGFLYVTVRSAIPCVQRYRADGTPYGAGGNTIDPAFTTGGQLGYPTGLIFGPHGDLYVTDFIVRNVVRFDGETGAYLGEFASAKNFPQGPIGLIWKCAVEGKFKKYGQSCGPHISHLGVPTETLTSRICLHNAQPSSWGYLFLGLQKISMDLTVGGMPGCFLLCTTDFVLPINTDSSGSAYIQIPVPANFSGFRVFVQFAVHTPGANAAQFLMSDGGEATVGKL